MDTEEQQTEELEVTRDAEQIAKRAGETTFRADSEDERVFEFSFSSEFPVQRGYGNEVLSHDSGAMDVSRLNGSAPLLFNHDMDRVIGVVERGYLDKEKKRGVARVRFSRNSFAQEVLNDVRDGIMSSVSVGYRINEMEERGDDFVATSWTPYEVSVVASPADTTVGFGRSLIDESNINPGRATAQPAAQVAPQNKQADAMTTTPPDLEVVRAEAEKSVLSKERARVAAIRSLCADHGLHKLGAQAEETGMSIEEVREHALKELSRKPVETVTPVDMGEVQREAKQDYNITAGIVAAMRGDWSSREAGLVKEISQEVQLKGGVNRTAERSFFIPFGALSKRATYVTSGATTGGNLVATDLLADEFVEALRNESSVMAMGPRILTGLVGDIAIPRRSATASGYWLSTETTAITQSESQFDQVSMVPRQLAALSKFSRQTLQQATPGIEQLIRTDLSDTIRLAMDAAVLNGSGSSGQPTGILQTSGIGSVAMGTNGAAIDLESVVDLETALAEDNALSGNLGYITNSKVIGNLKKLRAGGSASGDGVFLYNSDLTAIGRGSTPNLINGYPIRNSNQLPSNGTKGSGSNLSTMLFGNFSSVAVGLWGAGIEITLGEDSDDFSKLLQSVRAVTTMDVVVTRAESFAAITDIVTT